VPVHYLYRSFNEKQLVGLYRAADVMLVTPVRDGMNLVAKEFCASRPDEDGVLVLSEFAGAAAEMDSALIVNAYDVEAIADAIEEALELGEDERRKRMRALREGVKSHDVHWWTSSFLNRLQSLPSTAERKTGGGAEVLERMKAAPQLHLLLDYDGTLVGFASRPELAAPDDALRTLLAKLLARPNTSLSIVSGRPKETLEAWFGELPMSLHAEHGLWSRTRPGQPWRMLEGVSFEWKARARPVLDAFCERVPGSFLEEKTASLAWHYRMVDPEFGAIQARELRLLLLETFVGQRMDVLPGDRVVEVRPQGVHKGRVVGEATQGLAPGTLVVAIGDDRTDEDLFAAMPPGGLTINAGHKPTRAAFRVNGPGEVRKLLGALVS
jgi:trehalose 6-phosphate synthase/phosphatase